MLVDGQVSLRPHCYAAAVAAEARYVPAEKIFQQTAPVEKVVRAQLRRLEEERLSDADLPQITIDVEARVSLGC
jgi:hypothetical protein